MVTIGKQFRTHTGICDYAIMVWSCRYLTWQSSAKADTLLHQQNRGALLARCCCRRFMQIRRYASNCGKAGAITITRSIMMSDVRKKRKAKSRRTHNTTFYMTKLGRRPNRSMVMASILSESIFYLLSLSMVFCTTASILCRFSTCWFFQLSSKTLCLHSSHYSCVCMRWSCPYTHGHSTHIRQIRQSAGFRTWSSVLLCFMSGLDFEKIHMLQCQIVRSTSPVPKAGDQNFDSICPSTFHTFSTLSSISYTNHAN